MKYYSQRKGAEGINEMKGKMFQYKRVGYPNDQH